MRSVDIKEMRMVESGAGFFDIKLGMDGDMPSLSFMFGDLGTFVANFVAMPVKLVADILGRSENRLVNILSKPFASSNALLFLLAGISFEGKAKGLGFDLDFLHF